MTKIWPSSAVCKSFHTPVIFRMWEKKKKIFFTSTAYLYVKNGKDVLHFHDRFSFLILLYKFNPLDGDTEPQKSRELE